MTQDTKAVHGAEPPTPHMLAPDVGALVEYGLDSFGKEPARYRVKSWMRVAPAPQIAEDDWLGEILFEACQQVETKTGAGKQRMQWCLREEATHVSLTGICGAIAPIEACKVTGMVPWPKAQLDEARNSANRLGASHKMLF